MAFNASDRVRLRTDPGRVGVVTGLTRGRLGLTYHQVSFPDAVTYVPEDQLELVPAEGADPLRDLSEGRFASCADLRRTLIHVRLTGRLADLIYSIETTDTTFYAYQFKPVVKLLQSPGTGILVADEVGLGKTIEAGLIWTELRTRFDYRRILVLCPAVLREKWKRELSRRFGVAAEVLGANELLDRVRSSLDDGSTSDLAVIASMQGLRPPSGWDDSEQVGSPAAEFARLLERREHEEPLFDLLVIDEAHYLRNPETKTSQLGRLLRKVSAHAVLLSATPVHLRSDDLFHLLNLVDEDMFHRPEDFQHILQANEPLHRARDLALSGKATANALVQLLQRAEHHPLLRGNRQLGALLTELSDSPPLGDRAYVSRLAYRLELVNLLGFAVNRTRKRDVVESRVVREPHPEPVSLSPPERELYDRVTETVRRFCAEKTQNEGFLLVMPQRQMSSCMPAALRHWQRLGGIDEEDVYEDVGTERPDIASMGPLVQELVANVGHFGSFKQLRANDSKYQRLLSLLKDFLALNPGEKVVLFSYFRPTLAYLHERLYEDGISTIRLQGGAEDKDGVIERFQSPDGPSVLLSSEVGSEGIDLQFAWVVINYDLPWNPMRVEQRIGRVDRIGQASPKVVVWNLFYDDTIDARIYQRLYRRLRIFEESLGALEPILGDEIRGLTLDLLTKRLTVAQEQARIDQTAQALENSRLNEEKLEQDAAHLVAHGDYILNQVKAARELSRRVTGSDLRGYVLDYVSTRYPGTEVQELVDGSGDVGLALSPQAKFDFADFLRRGKLAQRTRLTQAQPRPVRCRFENIAVSGGGTAECISQFHPLVRFVSAGVRQLVEGARPAVAVTVSASDVSRPIEPRDYVFAIQRWSFSALQDQERLFYSVVAADAPATRLDDDAAESLVMAAATKGSDWLTAARDVDVEGAAGTANEACFAAADEAYRQFSEDLRAQNEDRADIQERALDTHLASQTEMLARIRERHAAAGRTGLARATEGRLAALRARVEQRRLKIQAGRQVKCSQDEVAVGIIRVTGG